MPRPPSDRVDEGFRIWSTEANRNDTKTAAIMGLSQETVSYWHRTYGWDARYLTVLQPDGELFAGLARAHIRAILPAVAERLRAIVEAKKPVYNDQGEPIGETWASSDRDAIQAAKLLTQYGFEGGAGQDSIALEAQAMPSTVLPRHPAFDALSVGSAGLCHPGSQLPERQHPHPAVANASKDTWAGGQREDDAVTHPMGVTTSFLPFAVPPAFFLVSNDGQSKKDAAVRIERSQKSHDGAGFGCSGQSASRSQHWVIHRSPHPFASRTGGCTSMPQRRQTTTIAG